VDEVGRVGIEGAGWTLDWWIGADDRWRVPARETTVRQSLIGHVPVVRTAVRVPSGDAVQRVFGIGGPGDPVIVEIENDSPAALVAALVVRGARALSVDGTTVVIDRLPALVAPRVPARWSVARGSSTDVEVCSGLARSGPFPRVRDRGGRLEGAFLFPVAHRAALRVVLGAAERVGEVPSATDAVRGWEAQLDRGLRVTLPDQILNAALCSARARVLLDGTGGAPTGADVAALEDWGFDAEAAQAWSRISGRERRRAARRAEEPPSWSSVRAASADGGARLLLTLRSMLVHDGSDGVIRVLGELPPEWRGQPIEVRAAPTRHGLVSYSVRWHGEHPALLWESPGGVTLRAPGLDPEWSTTEPCGEALLSGVGTP
jgi:hypothetical protein